MRVYLISMSASCSLLVVHLLVLSSAGNTEDAKALPKGAPPPPVFPDQPKIIKVFPRTEPAKKEDKKSDVKEQIDEEILRRAEIAVEKESLLKFFRKRTLPENDRPLIEKLVRQFQAGDYRLREKATLALTTRGVASLEVLRAALSTAHDPEMIHRIELTIQRIRQDDVAPEVPAAAVRLLAQSRPAGFIETLLGYLPFADNDTVVEEIRQALIKHALKDGKPAEPLLAALKDRSTLRRAVAGETLGRAAYAQHRDTLRKMLQDPDPLVRLRVAQALVHARERDVIPILIDTLAELPMNTAWQAEDFLLRLANGSSPPSVALSNDKNTREKCRLAWQSWWKKNSEKIDLGRVEDPPTMLGRTLIILLDQGKVLELGPDNLPRWEIKGLVFPLDAQLIDEDHVLIAEYHANRVTERNTRGEVLWQIAIGGPLVAQRLPNGNTFIATDSQFVEYDKDGKETLNIIISDEGRKIMKALKLPNGEIAAMLADSRIVRYDAKGQEVHHFPIALGTRLFGGRIHMLPSGRVLVPHNAEGKIVEYDERGKAIWEVAFEQPIAALRLPNGHTLITSMNPAIGAIEVDHLGVEVWSYRHSTRVTRAIRR